MTPVSSTGTSRKRVKVRRQRSLVVRFWWVGLLGAALIGVLWLGTHLPRTNHRQPIPGYITDVATLDQEYLRFHGSVLHDADVHTQFTNAAELASDGEYNGALLLLENVTKKAAVPAVFNDMGLLYAKLDDRARAVHAFQDALARDFDYTPVRRNLERLKGFTSNSADPVSREIEPNNNIENANTIALDKPVDAEIAQLDNDVDVYKITSPPAPRDLVSIHLENRSMTLAPRLSIYDDSGVILPYSKDVEQPGASLTQFLSPKPNTTLYLNIHGFGSSSGPYTLTVRALKSFDAYEPNDDIYNAKKIPAGQWIEANIMDEEDTDFYSFVAPKKGTLAVDIVSVSPSLIPALSTFSADKRSTGFGPDVRTPGAPLHHTIDVEDGVTYYIQVWPQGKSSGNYKLKIE